MIDSVETTEDKIASTIDHDVFDAETAPAAKEADEFTPSTAATGVEAEDAGYGLDVEEAGKPVTLDSKVFGIVSLVLVEMVVLTVESIGAAAFGNRDGSCAGQACFVGVFC